MATQTKTVKTPVKKAVQKAAEEFAETPIVTTSTKSAAGRTLKYTYPKDCVTREQRQTFRRNARKAKRKNEQISKLIAHPETAITAAELKIIHDSLAPCERCSDPAEGKMIYVQQSKNPEDVKWIHDECRYDETDTILKGREPRLAELITA